MYPDQRSKELGKRRMRGVSHTWEDDYRSCTIFIAIPVFLAVFGCLLMLLLVVVMLWQERGISGFTLNQFLGLSAVTLLSMWLLIRVVWQSIRPKQIESGDVEKQKQSAKKKKRMSQSIQRLVDDDNLAVEIGEGTVDKPNNASEQRE